MEDVVPLITVQNTLQNLQKVLECSICLELLKDPVATKCGHQFCRLCITKVLKRTVAYCPLCKEVITKRSLTECGHLKEIIAGVKRLLFAVQTDTGYEVCSQGIFASQLSKKESKSCSDTDLCYKSNKRQKLITDFHFYQSHLPKQKNKCNELYQDPESTVATHQEVSSKIGTHINISCGFPPCKKTGVKIKTNNSLLKVNVCKDSHIASKVNLENNLLLNTITEIDINHVNMYSNSKNNKLLEVVLNDSLGENSTIFNQMNEITAKLGNINSVRPDTSKDISRLESNSVHTLSNITVSPISKVTEWLNSQPFSVEDSAEDLKVVKNDFNVKVPIVSNFEEELQPITWEQKSDTFYNLYKSTGLNSNYKESYISDVMPVFITNGSCQESETNEFELIKENNEEEEIHKQEELETIKCGNQIEQITKAVTSNDNPIIQRSESADKSLLLTGTNAIISKEKNCELKSESLLAEGSELLQNDPYTFISSQKMNVTKKTKKRQNISKKSSSIKNNLIKDMEHANSVYNSNPLSDCGDEYDCFLFSSPNFPKKKKVSKNKIKNFQDINQASAATTICNNKKSGESINFSHLNSSCKDSQLTATFPIPKFRKIKPKKVYGRKLDKQHRSSLKICPTMDSIAFKIATKIISKKNAKYMSNINNSLESDVEEVNIFSVSSDNTEVSDTKKFTTKSPGWSHIHQMAKDFHPKSMSLPLQIGLKNKSLEILKVNETNKNTDKLPLENDSSVFGNPSIAASKLPFKNYGIQKDIVKQENNLQIDEEDSDDTESIILSQVDVVYAPIKIELQPKIKDLDFLSIPKIVQNKEAVKQPANNEILSNELNKSLTEIENLKNHSKSELLEADVLKNQVEDILIMEKEIVENETKKKSDSERNALVIENRFCKYQSETNCSPKEKIDDSIVKKTDDLKCQLEKKLHLETVSLEKPISSKIFDRIKDKTISGKEILEHQIETELMSNKGLGLHKELKEQRNDNIFIKLSEMTKCEFVDKQEFLSTDIIKTENLSSDFANPKDLSSDTNSLIINYVLPTELILNNTDESCENQFKNIVLPSNNKQVSFPIHICEANFLISNSDGKTNFLECDKSKKTDIIDDDTSKIETASNCEFVSGERNIISPTLINQNNPKMIGWKKIEESIQLSEDNKNLPNQLATSNSPNDEPDIKFDCLKNIRIQETDNDLKEHNPEIEINEIFNKTSIRKTFALEIETQELHAFASEFSPGFNFPFSLTETSLRTSQTGYEFVKSSSQKKTCEKQVDTSDLSFQNSAAVINMEQNIFLISPIIPLQVSHLTSNVTKKVSENICQTPGDKHNTIEPLENSTFTSDYIPPSIDSFPSLKRAIPLPPRNNVDLETSLVSRRSVSHRFRKLSQESCNGVKRKLTLNQSVNSNSFEEIEPIKSPEANLSTSEEETPSISLFQNHKSCSHDNNNVNHILENCVTIKNNIHNKKEDSDIHLSCKKFQNVVSNFYVSYENTSQSNTNLQSPVSSNSNEISEKQIPINNEIVSISQIDYVNMKPLVPDEMIDTSTLNILKEQSPVTHEIGNILCFNGSNTESQIVNEIDNKSKFNDTLNKPSLISDKLNHVLENNNLCKSLQNTFEMQNILKNDINEQVQNSKEALNMLEFNEKIFNPSLLNDNVDGIILSQVDTTSKPIDLATKQSDNVSNKQFQLINFPREYLKNESKTLKIDYTNKMSQIPIQNSDCLHSNEYVIDKPESVQDVVPPTPESKHKQNINLTVLKQTSGCENNIIENISKPVVDAIISCTENIGVWQNILNDLEDIKTMPPNMTKIVESIQLDFSKENAKNLCNEVEITQLDDRNGFQEAEMCSDSAMYPYSKPLLQSEPPVVENKVSENCISSSDQSESEEDIRIKRKRKLVTIDDDDNVFGEDVVTSTQGNILKNGEFTSFSGVSTQTEICNTEQRHQMKQEIEAMKEQIKLMEAQLRYKNLIPSLSSHKTPYDSKDNLNEVSDEEDSERNFKELAYLSPLSPSPPPPSKSFLKYRGEHLFSELRKSLNSVKEDSQISQEIISNTPQYKKKNICKITSPDESCNSAFHSSRNKSQNNENINIAKRLFSEDSQNVDNVISSTLEEPSIDEKLPNKSIPSNKNSSYKKIKFLKNKISSPDVENLKIQNFRSPLFPGYKSAFNELELPHIPLTCKNESINRDNILLEDLLSVKRPHWCFLVSGLSRKEMKTTEALTKVLDCRMVNKYSSFVSHLIVKTNENLTCERTFKYFLAIAGKKWVISYSWILKCLRSGKLHLENDFEVRGDTVKGYSHFGPKRSRTSSSMLFHNYEICCIGTFTEISKDELVNLLDMCGAITIQDPSSFCNPMANTVIVSQAFLKESFDYDDLYKRYGIPSVTREWVFDSVSTFTIQPITNYLLCDVRKVK